MAKDVRDVLSAKHVLIHIVDTIPNLEATSFTDEPFVNFFNKYYGDGASTFITCMQSMSWVAMLPSA